MSSNPNGGYVPPIETKYDLTFLGPYLFRDGKYFALPCHVTTDTFDAPLVAIGTQCNTNQYAVTQQFLKEYGESATQTHRYGLSLTVIIYTYGRKS